MGSEYIVMCLISSLDDKERKQKTCIVLKMTIKVISGALWVYSASLRPRHIKEYKK